MRWKQKEDRQKKGSEKWGKTAENNVRWTADREKMEERKKTQEEGRE